MSASRFRMLPPSAAPLYPRDILAGLKALGNPDQAQENLRTAIRDKFGVRHVFFTTSGRAGLSAGLQALHALNPDRDEVLLPAFTSFSVPSAVVNAGLKVSLYDLQADTLAPDMESLERAMGPRTLCVVVCHLFGYPVDLEPIESLCRRAGAFLFDDAAQAMGASIGGRLAGTMGDVGLFSLSRGKNMTAVDGGIVLTDRDDVAERIAGLIPSRRTGTLAFLRDAVQASALVAMLHPRAYWMPASMPFLNLGASIFSPQFEISGMDAFRCALATSGADRLDAVNGGRSNIAALIFNRLNTLKGVRTIRPLPGAEPVFLRLPVLPASGHWPGSTVPEAPALGVVRSYPLALHQITALAPHLAHRPACPVSESLAANLLTLPTHRFVTHEDLAALQKIFRGAVSSEDEASIWFSPTTAGPHLEKRA